MAPVFPLGALGRREPPGARPEEAQEPNPGTARGGRASGTALGPGSC